MAEVEEKDRVRNFQPPVTGDEIMKMFNLPASKVIGDIKEEIKDSPEVLDLLRFIESSDRGVTK